MSLRVFEEYYSSNLIRPNVDLQKSFASKCIKHIQIKLMRNSYSKLFSCNRWISSQEVGLAPSRSLVQLLYYSIL